MKQLFNIENKQADSVQEVLSIRLGEKHCSFAITNKTGDELSRLVYCSLDRWNEDELAQLKTAYPELGRPFYKVMIAYDNPQALLMPAWCYRSEDTRLFLQSMNGDLYGSHIISEIVAGWQLYTIYGMPRDVEDWMSQQFPSGNFRHQYSLGMKDIQAIGAGCLQVDFRTDEFTIIAARGSQVLLAQTFPYATPEDVLYYLLKICETFSLSQQELHLRLSGLIDQQSSLYRELHHYFIHTRFRDPAWTSADPEYPAHFFTSLNDLALCAS